MLTLRRWCDLLGRLGSRPWLAALLGVLLTLPSLVGGFAVDDHILRVGALGHRGVPGTPRPPYDLFSFLDGDPVRTRELIDTTLGTWILDPETRLHFLRPITSLTHALDFTLWPEAAWLMHLQNIGWYALLILLVGRLYRRLEVDTRLAGRRCSCSRSTTRWVCRSAGSPIGTRWSPRSSQRSG